jgi:CelD/BcsL family acetyltransferase involved in cellulose biosynthesis
LTVPQTEAFAARLHWNRTDCHESWLALETAGCSTAYQSASWIDCITQHLKAFNDAKIFFVELVEAATQRPVLLAAFSLTSRFRIKTIRWLNLEVCDYAAPLLARDFAWSPELAEAAWTAIGAVLPKADVIEITQIPADIFGVTNPLALLPQRRLMDLQALGMPIHRGTSLIERTMASKPLRELKRRRRRLEAVGNVRFVEADTEALVDELFRTMVEQRRERFERLGRFDLLQRPDYMRFYHDAAVQGLSGKSPARVFGVAVDDEWIATAYILVHQNVFHGVILSIGDEKWTKHGPGIMIIAELAAWAEANGVVYFDMTTGDMPYKQDLRPERRELFSLSEAKSFVGMGAMRLFLAETRFHAWLKKHPQLFVALRGARRGLRKVLRRSAASTDEVLGASQGQ